MISNQNGAKSTESPTDSSTSAATAAAQNGAPFQTSEDWLSHLIGPAQHLAVGVVTQDGKKAYFPTEVPGDAQLRDLLLAHVQGCLPPLNCLRKGEGFVVDKAISLGYYPSRRDGHGAGQTCVTNSITWDIDGPGHADGLSPEEVERVTWGIVDIAEEAGLCPTVVRSNSGLGRHVIVALPTPMPAGLAVYIAIAVISLVTGAEKTERFPRSDRLREGKFGASIALPLSGAAPGPGGGRIIDRHGNEVTVESVRIPPMDAFSDFIEAYERQKTADLVIKRCRDAEGRMLSHLAHTSGDDNRAPRVSLDTIVRTFAEIADDRETEDDIVGIRCPTHHGTCFHVNVDQGWFFCHKCGHKGGGPGAAYKLLGLLRPQWNHTQLRRELAQLESAGAPVPGAAP